MRAGIDEVFSWIENISKGNTKNPPRGGLNFITFRNPHSLQHVRVQLFIKTKVPQFSYTVIHY
jgi:hypothetical protein